MRAAVITVSTSRAAGEGEDEGGPALAAFAEGIGAEVAGTEVIPDDLQAATMRSTVGSSTTWLTATIPPNAERSSHSKACW